MDAFRHAAEAGDIEALRATLAEDVVFHSPAAFKVYRGRDVAMTLLSNVIEVLRDFHYIRVISEPDGRDHALVFEAQVGDKTVTGCDFIRVNDEGLVSELMVMIRPLSGLQALAQAMAERAEVLAVNAGERRA